MPRFNPNQQPISDSSYYVDIKMLIDATGSMGPIMNEVKQNAIEFHHKLIRAMADKERNVDQVRIQVIPFRDFAYTDFPAMEQSRFFSLPDDSEAYSDYVNSITPAGGGDYPESALEAIVTAMKGEWTSEGDVRRHVILVFTDYGAVPLGDPKRTAAKDYPSGMPKTLAELGEMWHSDAQDVGMPDARAQRLVVFAPNMEPWPQIEGWEKTWVEFVEKEKGLKGVNMDSVLAILVNSIAN